MPVNALVRVLSDEDVIRTLGHERSDEPPVGRGEVLALIDKDMIGDGTVASEVLRGNSGRLRERNHATDARVVSVLIHKLPYRITIATIESETPPGASRPQILLLGRDEIRQDDLLVLSLEQSVVS